MLKLIMLIREWILRCNYREMLVYKMVLSFKLRVLELFSTKNEESFYFVNLTSTDSYLESENFIDSLVWMCSLFFIGTLMVEMGLGFKISMECLGVIITVIGCFCLLGWKFRRSIHMVKGLVDVTCYVALGVVIFMFVMSFSGFGMSLTRVINHYPIYISGCMFMLRSNFLGISNWDWIINYLGDMNWVSGSFYMLLVLSFIVSLSVLLIVLERRRGSSFMLIGLAYVLIIYVVYFLKYFKGTAYSEKTLFVLSSVILFVSFASIFLVLASGNIRDDSIKSLSIIKFFPDLAILLLLGVFGFLGVFYNIRMTHPIGVFSLEHINIVCYFVVFYSLLGVVGFWIFWSLEASHFVSYFIHTCGLIFVGVLFFIVMLFFKGITYKVVYLVSIISLFSFTMYMVFFLSIDNVKRSLGFFSASSICYVFLLIVLGGPYFGLSVFFISSLIKVGFFYLVEKSTQEKIAYEKLFLGGVILLIGGLLGFHFCIFPVYSGDLDLGGGLLGRHLKVFRFSLYYILGLELVCLFIHMIKVYNSCFKTTGYHMSRFKVNLLILEGFIIVFLVFILLELGFVLGVKFHCEFICIIIVASLKVFFIFLLASDRFSAFERGVRDKIIPMVNFLFKVMEVSPKDMESFSTTLYDCLYRIATYKIGRRVSVGLLLFVILLTIWIVCYILYLSSDYVYDIEPRYVYDLYGNETIDPFIYLNPNFFRRTMAGMSPKEKVVFMRKTKQFFMGRMLRRNSYLDLFYNDEDNLVYPIRGITVPETVNILEDMGFSQEAIDKWFDPDLSVHLELYYPLMFGSLKLQRDFFVTMFISWTRHWISMDELTRTFKYERIMEKLKDSKYSHLIERVNMDDIRLNNALNTDSVQKSTVSHFSYVLYTVYKVAVWLGSLGNVSKLSYLRKYSETPDPREDDVYTGRFAVLFEIFKQYLLRYNRPVKGFEDLGDRLVASLEATVSVLSSMVEAPNDGRILFIKHDILDDVEVLTRHLKKGEREKRLKEELRRKHLEDIWAIKMGDIHLRDWYKATKDDKYPWFSYCLDYFTSPTAPKDIEDPLTMWSKLGALGLELVPHINWEEWDVEKIDDKIIGVREFIVGFAKKEKKEEEKESSSLINLNTFGRDVTDFCKRHPRLVSRVVMFLALGPTGLIINEIIFATTWSLTKAEKFDEMRKREEWVSHYYLHEEETWLPAYVLRK